MNKFLPIPFVLLLISLNYGISGQQNYSDSEITKLILLGTGTPNPDPMRSGCAIALVVNDTPYIIDFGPGLVRQAARLIPGYGGSIRGLEMDKLTTAFLTHLHSDHTAGYPDLILTPWVMGRMEPLKVYGPEGTRHLTEKILEAYQEDIKHRINGSEPTNDQGWRVDVNEFQGGKIYSDDNIKVEAFLVDHGTWPNAYGFKFTTPDKTIVISGDTRPCDNILEMSKGIDILVHEVYYAKGFEMKEDIWKEYHAAHHTSTRELGAIASKTRPGLVIMYHVLAWGATDEQLLDEISEVYDGRVVVGKDLDIF